MAFSGPLGTALLQPFRSKIARARWTRRWRASTTGLRASGRGMGAGARARRGGGRRRPLPPPPHADERGRGPRLARHPDCRPRPRDRAADARTERRRAPAAGPTGRSGAADFAAGPRRATGSSSAPGDLERAVALLDLGPERFVVVPNGFDPDFAPAAIERSMASNLVEHPQGARQWRGRRDRRLRGGGPRGAGRHGLHLRRSLHRDQAHPAAAGGVRGGPVRSIGPQRSLILVGGHPGEWEGEHPADAIEHLAVPDVFLAGWHSHDDLPPSSAAATFLVTPSVDERFDQVLVEAITSELTIRSRRPRRDRPDRGTTRQPLAASDPTMAAGLAAAIVAAVADPEGRRLRGHRARASDQPLCPERNQQQPQPPVGAAPASKQQHKLGTKPGRRPCPASTLRPGSRHWRRRCVARARDASRNAATSSTGLRRGYRDCPAFFE